MFEKDAEEYVKHWIVGEDDNALMQEAFKDGAEFGWNKANEWHYPSKGEYPEKGKEIILYTKPLGLIFGEFCEGYNNLWTSNRCDFTTEEIIAWIEKEKISPKEIE
jgi:hypothetical protein